MCITKRWKRVSVDPLGNAYRAKEGGVSRVSRAPARQWHRDLRRELAGLAGPQQPEYRNNSRCRFPGFGQTLGYHATGRMTYDSQR